MGQVIVQVDSFTDEAFKGNPAAVCILDEPMPDKWMQDVAMEMNLSETAFITKTKGKQKFLLRWFTPEAEVDLCGHATLASAHVLWEEGIVSPDQMISFSTASGELETWMESNWIRMSFPPEPATEAEPPVSLSEAIGAQFSYIGKNRMDYLVEVESAEILRKLDPDFNLLKKVDSRGIIVTSKSDSEDYDFIIRFFAPAVGVNEDPVTGSAFCCVGPYWQELLVKDDLLAYQASKRGGLVGIGRYRDRVMISGKAVTTLRAELLID